MNKKRIIGLSLVLIVIVGTAFIVWGQGEWTREEKEEAFREIDRFQKVLVRIQDNYVEDTDFGELIDAAIEGMLEELDPHSVYLDELDYQNLMISTEGKFGGLGITISKRDNFPTVISPIEGTPAYRLGIQGGDRIVEIEGESTRGWSSDDAVVKLRGEPGSLVNITVTREGLQDSLHFAITREIIEVPIISFADIFDGIGYIRIARFSKETARRMHEILGDFEKRGINGLILDLRSNPGGLLQSAQSVSDLFLEEGKLIVSTRGRVDENNREFLSDHENLHGKYPLVIMVNAYSASASEIVAGALQDWDRALIVGQTTFGKGSVQSVFPIGRTTALKLTTQKYYTPSGRCIHKERNQDGEVVNEIAEGEIREKYYTNNERVVYGGGGITPDWKLKLPDMTDLQQKLALKGIFFSFAIHYAAYHDVSDNFTVDQQVIDEFKDFASEKDIEINEENWTPENIDFVKTGIRREIFRKLHGTEGAYLATLPEDEEFQKVMKLFKETGSLNDMFEYVEKLEEEGKEQK